MTFNIRRWVSSIDCSYETARKVRIRDSRLGIFYRVAQLGIALYVLAYNIIVLQAYLKEAVAITGSVRLRLREPDAPYRLAAGAAPYCLGDQFNNTPGAPSSSVPGYIVDASSGTYQYVGGPGGLPDTPQHRCVRLDSSYISPGPRELNAVLLPTYSAQSPESVQDAVACAGFTALPVNGSDPCAFVATAPTTRTFLRDVDFWTLLIDHSMSSSNGLTRNAVAMAGRLVGKDGKNLDPCDAYAGTPGGCPSFIAAGAVGKPDIVSVRTLLRAAGIDSLDTEAGTVASLRGNTSRVEGKVLLLSISYSNYFAPFLGFDGTGSYDWSTATYRIDVSTVPEAGYSQILSWSNETLPAPYRVRTTQTGIRIVVSQTGRIGAADFQTLLINAMVSFGLVSLAAFVADCAALYCCRWRHAYKQYITRDSPNFDRLTRSGARAATLRSRFRHERHLVDPIPPVFLESLGGRIGPDGEPLISVRMPSRKLDAAGAAEADARDAVGIAAGDDSVEDWPPAAGKGSAAGSGGAARPGSGPPSAAALAELTAARTAAVSASASASAGAGHTLAGTSRPSGGASPSGGLGLGSLSTPNPLALLRRSFGRAAAGPGSSPSKPSQSPTGSNR